MKITFEKIEKIGSHILDSIMVLIALMAAIPIAIGLVMFELFVLVLLKRLEITLTNEAWMVLGLGMICLMIVTYVFCIFVMLRFGEILKKYYHKYIKQSKKQRTKDEAEKVVS